MPTDIRSVIVSAFDLVAAQVRHTESGGRVDPWGLVQMEAAREKQDREVFIGALSSVAAVIAHIASEEGGRSTDDVLRTARHMMLGPRSDPEAD